MFGRKTREQWITECRQMLVSDDRVGLWPWRDALVHWLRKHGASEDALKVSDVQLEFQDDTDLDWAYQAQTEGLRTVLEVLQAVTAKTNMRIFLSHSGADKPLVRDYYETLRIMGYEPWLDENAMVAGSELERALLQGMKASDAAVFFVTASFRDSGYLATEVNYAVGEKRKRPNAFSIITLVFEADHANQVPELLRHYVWKTPSSHLHGLREIIRALPTDSNDA